MSLFSKRNKSLKDELVEQEEKLKEEAEAIKAEQEAVARAKARAVKVDVKKK